MEGKLIKAWLISSTSPAAMLVMDLDKPLPLLPSQKINAKRTPNITMSHPSPPYQLQHKTSSISNPGMTSDSGSSSSEVSIEEKKQCTPDEKGIEIWDSYWSPIKGTANHSSIDLSVPPFHGAGYPNYSCSDLRSPLSRVGSTLSEINRNFATSDLSKLNQTPVVAPPSPPVSPPSSLHRSDAIRISRRRRASQPSQTQPHYPPFLSTPQNSPQEKACTAWPPRKESIARRPRAQTTPSHSRPRSPSNFSTCTTLDGFSIPSFSNVSSGPGSPLYMSNNSLKPLFAPVPPMDLSNPDFVEDISFFDDDDETDEEDNSAAMKLKKILHIRTSTSNQDDERPEREVAERPKGKGLRRLRKSLSDAASDANETLRCVFRRKSEGAM